MKVFFSILIFYLSQSFNAFADVKFSNYKDYEITKINFQLEEISKGLNYPWGMTFIDEENFLITEKNGRLLKINISTGKQEEISHELNIFTGRQGGLLDVLYHDNYVYFSYTHNYSYYAKKNGFQVLEWKKVFPYTPHQGTVHLHGVFDNSDPYLMRS